MRVLRGTKDIKGNKLFKQPAGGSGRLRCMRCQGLATPFTLTDGKQAMRCNTCGAVYGVTALDAGPRISPVRVGAPRAKTPLR